MRSTSIALLVLTIWPVSASWAQEAAAEAAMLTIVAEQVVAWMEVFVRRGSQWWIEAYHNVDVKRSAQP